MIHLSEKRCDHYRSLFEDSPILVCEQDSRESEEQYRVVSGKLETLLRSSAAILHTTDLRQRLKIIADAVSEHGWRRVVISLRDENLNTTDVVTAGLTIEEEQYLRDHQSPGNVWRKRLSSMFEKYRLGEFYYLPWDDPIVREQFKYALSSQITKEETVDWNPDDLLYIPLRLPDGQIVGIMSIDDPQDGRRPTKDSLAPLEIFAHQAAVAVENAQIIQQLEDARKRLKEHADHLEEKVEERTRDLRKSEEKLRSIFATTPDAITSTDINGRIVECNEQTVKMHEYSSKEEILGQSAFILIANKDHHRAMENLKKTIEQESVRNLEYTFLTKDGREFPAELSASLIKDHSGNPIGFAAVCKDITERKRMEQQLFRAERLAAIGELASMIGHDLRNPLMGITGAAYFIRTKCLPKTRGKAIEMLDIIERDIEYANKIINDLLDYSREIKLDLAETTPRSLAKEALTLINMPESIQLMNLTKNEPKMKVDIARLKRVFVNLIKNAIDAMPKGGALTIRSKKIGTNVEFVFTDNGIGITEEMIGRLFVPLFTTKAKGMGFGLAICKRIIEAHGGHISVESTVDKGTTFKMAVPIEPETEGEEGTWINLPESLSPTRPIKQEN